MRIRLGVVVACLVICTAVDGGSQTVAHPMTCAALEGLAIPASGIGLPTKGATVVSATLVPASDQRVQGAQVVLAIADSTDSYPGHFHGEALSRTSPRPS